MTEQYRFRREKEFIPPTALVIHGEKISFQNLPNEFILPTKCIVEFRTFEATIPRYTLISQNAELVVPYEIRVNFSDSTTTELEFDELCKIEL